MLKIKQKSKLRHDYATHKYPDVEKKELSRLSGLVIGARTDIVKKRGKIVSLLPVVAIVFIYTLNTIPFFFIEKIPVVAGSPIVGLLIGIISVIPFIGSHSLFIIGGSFLIIGSVLWFYFLRYITKRTFIAFFTVIAWISPLFMKPVSFLGISIPYILYSGFLVEDISSVIGLSLIPIPLYFLLLYLRKQKAEYFIKSVIGVSVVAFISPLSLFNLLILSAIIGYSEMMLGQGRIKFIRLISVLISGILITLFWYHPVYLLSLIGTETWATTIASLTKIFPLIFFIVPVLFIVSFLLFDRKPQLQPLFIGIFTTLIYGIIHLSESSVDGASLRFLPEYALGFSLLLGVVIADASFYITTIFLKKAQPKKWFPQIPYIISSFLLGFFLVSTLTGSITVLSMFSNLNADDLSSISAIEINPPKIAWFSGVFSVISIFLGLFVSTISILFLYSINRQFNKTGKPNPLSK